MILTLNNHYSIFYFPTAILMFMLALTSTRSLVSLPSAARGLATNSRLGFKGIRIVATLSSSYSTTGLRAYSKPDLLIGASREAELKGLLSSGWQPTEGRDALKKTFKFKNFIDAFGFMTQAAIVAEGMNHHPEWFNVYNR